MIFKYTGLIFLLTVVLGALFACDPSDRADSELAKQKPQKGISHFPKREVLFNCDNAPEDAILNKHLSESLKNLVQITCKKGLGHILSSEDEHIWLYREGSYGGIKVPFSGSLNAKIENKSDGKSFHDNYFIEITINQLDENQREELTDLIRSKNPSKPIAERRFVSKIEAVNQKGISQRVYLFSDQDFNSSSQNSGDGKEVLTIGFVCNPDCDYDNMFYKRVWHNTAKMAAELRKEYSDSSSIH